MRIPAVDIKADGLPTRISLAPMSQDARNWVTVVIGDNGSRKSLLLRLIAGTAVGKPDYKSPGHKGATLHFSQFCGKLGQVLAISGTPYDRFPGTSTIPRTRAPTGFDVGNFHYFGPRNAGSLAGRGRTMAGLLYSLLAQPDRHLKRQDALRLLFRHLGYADQISFKVRRPKRFDGPQAVSKYAHEILSRQPSDGLKKHGGLLKVAEKILSQNQQESFRMHRILEAMPLDVDADLSHPIDLPMQVVDDEMEFLELLEFGFIEVQEAVLRVGSRRVSMSDMSSGQWQLFYSLFSLALAVEDDSLVLIDEPENSLHPSWQREYIGLLHAMLRRARGCHAIVATHSPLIAAGVRPDTGSLVRLGLDVTRRETVAVDEVGNVFGWLPNDVLEEYFGLSSTRAPELAEAIDAVLGKLKYGGRATELLRGAGERVKRLAQSLPPTDPLLPAINAITRMIDKEDFSE